MSNTRNSHLGSIVAFVMSAVLIVTAVWVFLNRQFVLDHISVWSYKPSAEIATINERVQFTEKGKFIFYATSPAVAKPDDFNKKCPRQEAGSPILGCYTNDDHIYIYDLTDEKLDGMEEVTAAHEMLHAVWFRASSEEKEKLTSQLKAAYSEIQNKDLTTRMQYYERTEPGEFVNELHAILGTEVESLGEPLESYYSQFFDRQTVLKLHDQYNSVYRQLYERAEKIYADMETLSVTIKNRSRNYEVAIAQLSADIASFNRRANNNDFATQSQFNSQRNALLARTNELDAERRAINGDIDRYEAYSKEYQDIAKQIELLNDSIDSFKQIDRAPSV